MQMIHLLFLVVVAPNGELSSAYSTYSDAVECEAALDGVATIFDAQGVKTAYRGCVLSKHSFSPFKHNVPKDAPRYVIQNQLVDGKLQVTLAEDLKACQSKVGADAKDTWCTTTTQTVK